MTAEEANGLMRMVGRSYVFRKIKGVAERYGSSTFFFDTNFEEEFVSDLRAKGFTVTYDLETKITTISW